MGLMVKEPTPLDIPASRKLIHTGWSMVRINDEKEIRLRDALIFLNSQNLFIMNTVIKYEARVKMMVQRAADLSRGMKSILLKNRTMMCQIK